MIRFSIQLKISSVVTSCSKKVINIVIIHVKSKNIIIIDVK